jgi:outer membrane lipoprotein-sorting protein
MKKSSILLALISLPLYVSAIPQPQKKALAAINIPVAFEVSFTYTLQEKEHQEAIVLQGKAWMQGAQYHLVLEDQELISDGKTCWQYLKGTQEVYIQQAVPMEDTHSSFSLVYILRRYRKDFVPLAIEPCLLDRQACDRIVLQPKHPDAFITSLVFTVVRKSKELKHIQAVDKENTYHSLTILKLLPKKVIAAHHFKFSPPSDTEIEVVDLR